MKQIGHIDIKRLSWGSDLRAGPDKLYIPNPGERENIDAEAYELIGWVNPDKNGGGIYPTHAEACVMGDDPRPAYIRRVLIGGPVSQDVISTRTIIGLGRDDPMDVRRSEFHAHAGALDSLTKAIESLTDRLRKLEQPKPAPTVQAEPPISFYDGAFIAAYIDLRSADYDDITRIQRAHTIAAKLTRNRAVPA